MNYFYAQIDEDNICVAVSILSGEVSYDNMVKIEEFNQDYLGRKYENNKWSEEKFKTEVINPEPLFEEVQIEQNVDFDYRLSLLEMGLI